MLSVLSVLASSVKLRIDHLVDVQLGIGVDVDADARHGGGIVPRRGGGVVLRSLGPASSDGSGQGLLDLAGRVGRGVRCFGVCIVVHVVGIRLGGNGRMRILGREADHRCCWVLVQLG